MKYLNEKLWVSRRKGEKKHIFLQHTLSNISVSCLKLGSLAIM